MTDTAPKSGDKTETKTETKTVAEEVKVTATLVRGRYFDYRGKVWDTDKNQATHEVSPEEEAYLREHGVDFITVEGEKVPRPKFSFSNDTTTARVRKR